MTQACGVAHARRVRAVWLAGLLQTGLYADFFYYYFKSWKANDKLKLPA
jgi:hypothetical protein